MYEKDLKDYRLITLLGSMNKLLFKVLANKAQNVVLEGKYTLDASLMTNEIIDSILKKKENAFCTK